MFIDVGNGKSHVWLFVFVFLAGGGGGGGGLFVLFLFRGVSGDGFGGFVGAVIVMVPMMLDLKML